MVVEVRNPMTQIRLPKNWKITGWGPEGEGVEATGPNGAKVIAPRERDLLEVIREIQR